MPLPPPSGHTASPNNPAQPAESASTVRRESARVTVSCAGKKPGILARRRRALMAVLRNWQWCSLVGLLGVVLTRPVDIFLLGNFSTVVPNQCYRSAQPSEFLLEELSRRYEFQTIVNLRGPDSPRECLEMEEKFAYEHGMHIVHINFSSIIPPRLRDLRLFLETIDEQPGPFLMHCNSGSDRTGLAVAMYMLLKTDATLAEAQKQLDLFHGHLSWGRARSQTLMLKSYEYWLAENQRAHSRTVFRYWLDEVYDGKVEEDL